jgi:hypothetical protein
MDMNALKTSAVAVTDNVNQGVNNIGNSLKTTIQSFGDPSELATTSSDFLQSNSMVAKVNNIAHFNRIRHFDGGGY